MLMVAPTMREKMINVLHIDKMLMVAPTMLEKMINVLSKCLK